MFGSDRIWFSQRSLNISIPQPLTLQHFWCYSTNRFYYHVRGNWSVRGFRCSNRSISFRFKRATIAMSGAERRHHTVSAFRESKLARYRWGLISLRVVIIVKKWKLLHVDKNSFQLHLQLWCHFKWAAPALYVFHIWSYQLTEYASRASKFRSRLCCHSFICCTLSIKFVGIFDPNFDACKDMQLKSQVSLCPVDSGKLQGLLLVVKNS